MKYPKLFDGPSPVGESSIRALDNTPAPFLSIAGPDGTIAYKRNLFREVTIAQKAQIGLPYYWTEYATSTTLNGVSMNPETKIFVADSAPTPPFGRTPTIEATPFRSHVGDNYKITYYRDGVDPFGLATFYWPTLEEISRPTPRYPGGDPLGAGNSVDFSADILANGLADTQHQMSTFALGYRNDATRFNFGVGYLEIGPDTIWLQPDEGFGAGGSKAWVQRMYFGNTATRTVSASTLPTGTAGHAVDFTTPTCVGKGQTQALIICKESSTTFTSHVLLGQIAPFFRYSGDWGATWVETAASFLASYMSQLFIADGRSIFDRDYYYNQQLDFMALFHSFHYAGGGKVWLFIPNGMDFNGTDGLGGPHIPDPAAREYRAMLFYGDVNSASMTRVPWPLDTMQLFPDGFPSQADALAVQCGWRRLLRMKQAQFAFGAGCLYVPIIQVKLADALAGNSSTDGWKIMFTLDAGASWQYNSAPVPAAVQHVGNGCFAGTIIKPWLSTDNPGKIFFTGFDASTSTFEVWSTTGNFDAWKRVYSRAGANEPASIAQFGHYPLLDSAFFGVNFGNGKAVKSYIYPAFPGEFEAP